MTRSKIAGKKLNKRFGCSGIVTVRRQSTHFKMKLKTLVIPFSHSVLQQ